MSKRILAVLVVAALPAVGCSSNNGTSSTIAEDSSGAVIGPLDHHCIAPDGGLVVQTIGACQISDLSLEPANAASCGISFDTDAGAPSAVDGGSATSDYGPTMYGSAGDDDDCKYYVSWVSTPIKENVDTYFTVTALRLEDMKPATCATIIPDTALTPTHPPAGPPKPSVELSPGVYKVGPIPFDAPGIWTVRFHLYEECSDDPDDSPHGHAAFYVQVP